MSVNQYDAAHNQLIPVVGTNNHFTDAMLAYYERTAIATRAYVPDDQIILNETLYIVTDDIAIGDTITSEEGGNCELAPSITDQLKNTESGIIISYADWLLLTPEEKADGDYYIPDYPVNGSIMPVGGFDITPTLGSMNPVTSDGIAKKINDIKQGSVIKITPLSSSLVGTTVTVTGPETTVTKTLASDVTTDIENFMDIGDVVISATGGGVDYVETIKIRYYGEYDVNLGTPKGSTITPVNTIQTWLATGGIIGKTYTTLNKVLADTPTLHTLINNHNAMDYLVRSTDWVSGICGSVVAMTYIGENNYASDTLLDDSTWLTGICNSTYMEKVLNTKVPTMTSNTAPSGEVLTNAPSSANLWQCFDGDLSTRGIMTDIPSYPARIIYKFPQPVCVRKFYYNLYQSNAGNPQAASFKIQGSNDNLNWTNLSNDYTTLAVGTSEYTEIINNSHLYLYYAVAFNTCTYKTSDNRDQCYTSEIQFYGRTPVAEPTDLEARVESLENQVGNTDISDIGATVTGAIRNMQWVEIAENATTSVQQFNIDLSQYSMIMVSLKQNAEFVCASTMITTYEYFKSDTTGVWTRAWFTEESVTAFCVKVDSTHFNLYPSASGYIARLYGCK